MDLVKDIFLWLKSQFPGIILGAVVSGLVGDFFAKRAEGRGKKDRLIRKLSKIFIEAEEELWKNDPPSEKEFLIFCKQLSRHNFRLADKLRINYYIIWCGIWGAWTKPRSEWTKEEVEMHKESIKDLRKLNNEFMKFAYPDRNYARSLFYYSWRLKYKIKNFFRRFGLDKFH